MAEISALMCVYNGEKYLSQSIDSILGQSFSDFEFILVNDGSTDRSSDILSEYAQEDNRIILVNNRENVGIAASVTNGLQYCTGKYIARMDQDDIALPERFNVQHQYLETHPEIDAVGTGLIFIDENGMPTGKRHISPTDPMIIRLEMYYHCVLHNPSVMMRSVYYQLYNERQSEMDFMAADDYSFWLRKNTHHLYANIAEPYLYYRVHQGQTSSSRYQRQRSETLRSAQMAYADLLGYMIPYEVIESFYYVNRVDVESPESVRHGLETIYRIQRAFEEKNPLTSIQKTETRKYSYEKIKSMIAKYQNMPGVRMKGRLLLLQLSPAWVLQDVLGKFRSKPEAET